MVKKSPEEASAVFANQIEMLQAMGKGRGKTYPSNRVSDLIPNQSGYNVGFGKPSAGPMVYVNLKLSKRRRL